MGDCAFEQRAIRRDVKIQAGFDGHSLDMQNMLDKRMDTIRLTLKQREYNANKKAAEVAASK